jgi:hypothetical protein
MTTPTRMQLLRHPDHLSDVDRRAVLVSGSGSPYARAVQMTLERRLADLRAEFEGQPANEFTRGRINEIRRVIDVLSTGDTHD